MSFLRSIVPLSTVAFGLLFATPGAHAQEPRLPDDPLAAIAAMPAHEPVDTGTPVRVLGADRKPIAGATVVVIGDRPEAFARLEKRKLEIEKQYDGDQEQVVLAAFALFGKRFVTDNKGEVRVPALGPAGSLLGVHGRNYLSASADAGKDGVVTLLVVPNPPMHVRVVGPKGQPVRGVPLALVLKSGGMQRVGKTDRSGRGRVRIHPWFKEREKSVWIAVLAVTTRPVRREVAVDFVNDAGHPVELRMPAFGRVRVQARTKGGKLLAIDNAYLTVAERDIFEPDARTRTSVTFTAVEVGLPFEVQCEVGGAQRPQTARGRGPDRHLGVRVVTIGGVSMPKRITGRVIGRDGKPVRDEDVGVMFADGDEAVGTSARTDGDGRFEVAVPDAFEDLVGSVLVERRPASTEQSARRRYGGAKKLSLAVLAGKRSIDVRLEAEALVVSGRVVDATGRGVAGVTVSVEGAYGNFESFDFSGNFGFFDCSDHTGSDGRFELRVLEPGPGPLELAVMDENYALTAGRTFELGAKDHRIVVGSLQPIHARLRGARGLPYLDGIRVLDARGAPQDVQAELDDAGGMAIHGVLPGEYTVELRISDEKQPFLTIDRVRVEAGKPCRDPRMMDIDLTKYVRIVKLRVLQPDGKPSLSSVTFQIDGRIANWAMTGPGTGYVVLPKAGATVTITPTEVGLLPRRIQLRDNDLDVTLEPAVRVELAIAGFPELPDTLLVRPLVDTRATKLAESALGRLGQPSWSLAGGRIGGFVPEPGDYVLTLDVWIEIDGGTDLDRAGTIELPFTAKATKGKLRPIELTLDAEQRKRLQGWIEAAERKKKR